MTNTPLVGIVMGSDSDLAVMQEAGKALEIFGIGYEIHVMSAHRTPDVTVEYVRKSEAAGYKAFICGAGGAAHLAGVVAAHTSLPVIGVPLTSKTMGASGLDSLYSTVQMPPGIPVATVAINGAKNAGILAAQIIGASDESVRVQVTAYKEKMAKDISAKDAELQEKGVKKYLEDKPNA
jgi:5-(carboxyamino)imidazole ribonucleotide mutase